MILGIPVQDGWEMTDTMLKQLVKVSSPNLKVVIIDNDSDTPYQGNYHYGIPIPVIHNDKNLGYYYPLKQLYEAYPEEELIGVMHNDMLLYEEGWDERMKQCFEADPQLGLVGLCGSNEIDSNGGRGGGTMLHFAGRSVQVGENTYTAQPQSAGRLIHDLEPSACLDSLFMMFRREVIPHLMNDTDPWEDITLAHFYDRIWPIRTIEAGYRVGTLGVECDHIGGLTTTGNMRFRNDCIAWLDERGSSYENPETEMYLIAERRYLSEYRENKHFLPCIVGGDYVINHLNR